MFQFKNSTLLKLIPEKNLQFKNYPSLRLIKKAQSSLKKERTWSAMSTGRMKIASGQKCAHFLH